MINGQPNEMDSMYDTMDGEAEKRPGETVTTASLPKILRDITYPAEKWHITMCAQLYGADVHTRRQLYKLPPRVYHSVADIADALGMPPHSKASHTSDPCIGQIQSRA
jgi:hypothetical protein